MQGQGAGRLVSSGASRLGLDSLPLPVLNPFLGSLCSQFSPVSTPVRSGYSPPICPHSTLITSSKALPPGTATPELPPPGLISALGLMLQFPPRGGV